MFSLLLLSQGAARPWMCVSRLLMQRLKPELEKIKEQLGVDSLTFLSIDALRTVVGDDLCSACFDGNYVVDVSNHEQNTILEQRRRKSTPASAAIE